jgi:hypothetical protein
MGKCEFNYVLNSAEVSVLVCLMLIGLWCIWHKTRHTIEYYVSIVSVYIIIINQLQIYCRSHQHICIASIDITIYRIRTCVKCYIDIAMWSGPKAFHAAGVLLNGKTNLHNYHAELVTTPWIFIHIEPTDAYRGRPTDTAGSNKPITGSSCVLMGWSFERIQRTTKARHLPFPIHLCNTGGSDTSLALKWLVNGLNPGS